LTGKNAVEPRLSSKPNISEQQSRKNSVGISLWSSSLRSVNLFL